MNQKWALVVCWLLAFGLSLFHLYNQYQSYQNEVALQHRIAAQTATSALERANGIIKMQLQAFETSAIFVARLLTRNPQFLHNQSTNEDYDKNELDKILNLANGRIAFITEPDGTIVYHDTLFERYIENKKVNLDFLFKRAPDHDFPRVFWHHGDLGPSLLSKTEFQEDSGKKYYLVMDFPLQLTKHILADSNSKIYLLNKYNTGFRVGNLEPVQFTFENDETQADITDKERLQAFGIVPEQTIKLIQHNKYGLEFYSLDSEENKNLTLVSKRKVANGGWQLLVFSNRLSVFSKLKQDLLHGIYKISLTLLIFFLFDRFIRYHYNLKTFAYIDPLTKLYNRNHFYKSIEGLEQLHEREKVSNIGLLALDIDHFKHVNDHFGHLIGDQVLEEVAKIIRDSCRKSELIYRFGGEEFQVFCLGEQTESLQILAERIRENVEHSKKLRRFVPKGLTVSIGIAVRVKGENYDQFLNRADERLYQAKDNGRNQVIFE
ncbi:diguanylate cyclase [Vibrio sp. Of7-15]|uniref:sensor domain-containing diguanylate cyclase n=1 Tax=Vibrio sp. Of7-15 TaxID=2724879 RepID=UPI001EF17C77|nr:sensor domain-containing diguanylate cyclase [Vibrio sp. Of7-15]MCG7495480.1 diguanylate cyclase [Vibrio sp. Of7-15]